MNPCGTTRRLRALVAIGWDTTTLAQQLGWPERLTTAVINGDTNPPKRSHHPVAHLYDRLSMTPGPNQAARQHAQQHGWAPPLAWDDHHLDNPTGTPADGWQRHTPKPTFTARYAEWRELGYTDLEITRRFNIRADTLATMLYRAGLPVTPQLAEASHQRKHRGRAYA